MVGVIALHRDLLRHRQTVPLQADPPGVAFFVTDFVTDFFHRERSKLYQLSKFIIASSVEVQRGNTYHYLSYAHDDGLSYSKRPTLSLPTP